MKKGVIIIVAIIILGGGFYFFMNAATAPTVNDNSLDNEAGGLVVRDSLLGWLKKGKGVECTIDAEEGKVTVYASGEKVRMEGLSMLPNKNEDESSVFLADGNYVYIWNGTDGLKVDINKMNEMSGEGASSEANRYSWEDMARQWDEARVKYDCHEQALSDDLFTIPDDVAFVDLAESMQALSSLGTSTSSEEMASGTVSIDKDAMENMVNDLKKNIPEQ